jgi:hypothetical protein
MGSNMAREFSIMPMEISTRDSTSMECLKALDSTLGTILLTIEATSSKAIEMAMEFGRKSEVYNPIRDTICSTKSTDMEYTRGRTATYIKGSSFKTRGVAKGNCISASSWSIKATG